MQILVACLLVHSRVVFGKSTTLVLGDSSKSGASVESIHTDVSESSAGWSIQTTTTQGFHLKLSMDNTWGFRPGHKSTIQIIIDGDTPLYVVPAPGMPNPDLEALFAASISNQQYIAFEISLDNNGQDNYASPGCSDSTPISMWDDDDVNAIVDVDGGLDRWDTMSQRTRLQNMNGWGTPEYISETIFKPSRDFNLFPQAFAWPLTFTFENDPINDILKMSFSTPSWNGFTQYCLFNAFSITDAGLALFMALDDNGETINYKSFTISESYEQTSSPITPSGSPTLSPTHPSVSPTNPTYKPTLAPTNDPSSNPTLNPTNDPSLSPTFQPTLAPTNPSFNPTLSPTNDPLPNPTVNPTLNPSVSPTNHPSGSSTHPSVSPTNPTPQPTLPPTTDPTHNPTLVPSRDANTIESDSSGRMNVFVTILIIICVAIVVVCIAIVCFVIKSRKGSKKTKEIPVILGGDIGVVSWTNNKQIAIVSSSDVKKERDESFEVISDHETRTQGYDDEEEEAQRKPNQLGEGKSIPNDGTLERVFATNPNQKEDSFEVIGNDETPMDNGGALCGTDDDIVDGKITMEGDESLEEVDEAEDDQDVLHAVNRTRFM
eukprot:557224_1